MWKILDTGQRSAQENMEIDAELLENLDPLGPPILHFYEWEGECATYGHFLKPEDFLNLKAAKERGVSLARRPTGGGIIFHVSDLAFSILVPSGHPHYSLNTLGNYNFINSHVKKGVKNFLDKGGDLTLLPEEPLPKDSHCQSFCMAKPTRYDVMLGGLKIAGAAQRRRKQGYLHQGSISIALPKEDFLDALLLPGTQVKEAMKSQTFSLLGKDWTTKELEKVRSQLKKELEKELSQ
ncbi:MAG: hypothetical protein KDK60_03000 [Chlamydiia bacterium]|nr:hypothetical protein [Chlamydiia bacterium]